MWIHSFPTWTQKARRPQEHFNWWKLNVKKGRRFSWSPRLTAHRCVFWIHFYKLGFVSVQPHRTENDTGRCLLWILTQFTGWLVWWDGLLKRNIPVFFSKAHSPDFVYMWWIICISYTIHMNIQYMFVCVTIYVYTMYAYIICIYVIL